MSRVARLALLYFTAFRSQRVLAVAGLALLGVGFGLMLLSPGPGSALALAGLACVLLPTTASSGFVLRALSVPRSQRLIPKFRQSMLVALALVVVVEAAGAAIGWWLLADERSAEVLIEGLSVGVLLASAALIWTFAMTGSPLKSMILLTGTYALWAWAVQLGTTWLFVSASLAAVPASALLWLLFGIWYRRVRRVAPVGIFQSLTLPAGVVTVKSAGSAPPSEGLYLGDRLPWRFSRRLAAVTAIAAAAAVVVWVLDRLDRRIEVPLSTLLNLPLIVTFLGLPRVYRMVSHSRALWLRTPGLRAGVFRACEREALRDVTWNVVFASLLVSGFILARPSLSWAMLPWAVLLYLATGLLIAYLGLMLVRGLRATDLTGGLLLAASSFVALTPLGAEPMQPAPVAAVVAFELLSALTLRAIAARRWTAIDWLALRAPRARSQPAGAS